MKKILGIVVFSTTSCETFLDVNEDPNRTKTANLGNILTYSQVTMASYLGHASNMMAQTLSVYVQHNTTRELNDYNMDERFLNNFWLMYSWTLAQLERVISDADANPAFAHYGGIAKIMKAFMFVRLVDVFGEVPMTQAFDFIQFPHPKFDKGYEVYNAAIALLREAKVDLGRPAPALPAAPPIGNMDLIYGGDANRWIRAANSLMFMMATNTRLNKTAITNWQGVLDEALRGPRIQGGAVAATASDFEFLYTNVTSPVNERLPAYGASYAVSQQGSFPSVMLWETMNGRTLNIPNNPMAGIVDPRIPYYIYQQSNAASALTGDPIYRDGGFVTILMGGSGDPNLVPTATQLARTAVWGVYPVGGVFQANTNGVSTSISANTHGILGAVPQKFYTFTDMKFNEAEMILTGNMPGGEAGAREALSDAIDAAFAHINKTVGGRTQTLPMAATIPTIPDATRNTFRNAVLARFDAASTTDAKLEVIMVQKWIHNVNNSFQAFNSLRRTGFPRLINPNGVVRDPATGRQRVTGNSFNFPNTLGYPWSEVNTNQNIQQKDLVNLPKPFWMTIDLNPMVR
jgi:hypothetical protein